MSTTKRQPREPLNTRQRSILTTFYNQNAYPSASERQHLVQLTGRTLKQVQDWFSNRRVSVFFLYYYLILKSSYSVVILSWYRLNQRRLYHQQLQL